MGTLKQVSLSQSHFLSSVISFNGSEEIRVLVRTSSFFHSDKHPFLSGDFALAQLFFLSPLGYVRFSVWS